MVKKCGRENTKFCLSNLFTLYLQVAPNSPLSLLCVLYAQTNAHISMHAYGYMPECVSVRTYAYVSAYK